MKRLAENLVTHVAVLWGDDYPLLVTQLPRGEALRLGGERGPLSLCTPGPWTLLDEAGRLWVPRGASLRWLQRGHGAVAAPPEPEQVEQAWVALHEGDRVRMRHGPLRFHLEVAERETCRWRRLVLPRGEAGSLWAMAGSLALHGLFLALGALLPPTAEALSLDLLGDDLARARYLIAATATPPPPPTWLDAGEREGGESAPAPGDEGADGDPEVADRRPRKRRPQPASTSVPEERVAATHAGHAGILGVLEGFANEAGPSPFEPAAVDADARAAMGAIFGDVVGSSHGLGGLGIDHAGRGGGGPPHGTRRVGPLGTRGGRGVGPGVGAPTGVRRGGSGRPPKLRSTVEVAGSLSKEAIRRTIRRHMNEVRFCYEQALRTRPDLAGRVRVFFLIQPDGSVASAGLRDSTVGEAGVEACIVRAVRRWGFPRPRQGGMVKVTYPFMLRSSP